MKRFAVGLALLMLLTTLAAPLPAWCLTGVCAPTEDDAAVSFKDCCESDTPAQASGGGDDCLNCVSVDDAAPTIPDRPADPLPSVVLTQQPPIPSLVLLVSSERTQLLPTGPPITSAILRDLRTIRLLI